ncbi:MAG: helix-hairpin-helix domain-containing protein [Xanthomonadales bacterium]|nr:helix-hairpin-helix domain-containing protein [Xanthomonadales bacterium]
MKMNKIVCFALLLMLYSMQAMAAQPVNINKASAQQIAESLDGVGLSKAQAIVEYRNRNGSFKHPDELVNVKGIGLSTLDRNRGFIRLTDSKGTKAQKSS